MYTFVLQILIYLLKMYNINWYYKNNEIKATEVHFHDYDS